MNIARGVVRKKATHTVGLRTEHPICAMLWHVCTRQPHVFEYMLWTLWLLVLTFWGVIFVLVVHYGATKHRAQQSRCILDLFCFRLQEPGRRRSKTTPTGRVLHALSLEELMEEVVKLGYTKLEAERQQRNAQGSPKEPLVRMILGLASSHTRDKAAQPDEEMAVSGQQPQRPINVTSSSRDGPPQ